MDEERRETPDGAADEPDGDAAGDTRIEDASNTTAPSIGPNTVIDRSEEKSTEEVREASPEDPETGLREIDLDAMGHDKRRQVVGHSYGASAGKQVVVYAVVVALIVALAFGAKVLIDHFDKGSNPSKPEAPWAQPGVQQKAPQPLE